MDISFKILVLVLYFELLAIPAVGLIWLKSYYGD